ncbi:AraC family transcriptional regulator [Streptomyces sp. NBC_00370]|uniref:AraC family transcriptional regulator n=1 Tax=Streptomyces sp. NBC_00370 TaxID=2975728 RepID=UPI002E25962A
MEPPLDPLSDVFASLNVRTGSFSGLDAGGRWGLRFRMRDHIKIGAVLSGSCLLSADGGEPLRLTAGDCFLLAAHEEFVLSDGPRTPLSSGEAAFAAATGRIVRVGDDNRGDDDSGEGGDEGRTLVIAGSVHFLDATVALLLSGLPPASAIRADTPQARAIQPLLTLFREEVGAVRLGASVMSARLTEILFIQAMRALVAGEEPAAGWLGALGDPRIGGALLVMHQQAARRWTVAELGREVGMSRAGFAARFKQLVGMPPLVYLQRWRVLAAGKELRGGERTVAAVAADWGYTSESAFSNAFKRVTGVSPARYRNDPAAAAPEQPRDRFGPRPHPSDNDPREDPARTNAQVF